MERVRELEYKSMITKEKYDQLDQMLTNLHPERLHYTQTNYYFDTPDHLLAQNKISLRLREKEATWEMTIKLPIKDAKVELYSASDELNFELNPIQARLFVEHGLPYLFVKKVLDPFIKMMDVGFKCFGSLTTERTDFISNDGTISLDKSLYHDVVDYELEWETTNHDHAQFMLKRWGIQLNNGKGKRSRFFKALARIQGL